MPYSVPKFPSVVALIIDNVGGIGQWHWALGMGIRDLQINMQIATKRRDDCGLWTVDQWTVDFYKTPIYSFRYPQKKSGF